MPPRLSIGMPVYNAEAFLNEAIESLLSQTFGDFELIISDNDSSDGTEAICRRYAGMDSRIRYERQEVNRGAAWNFNRVARLAQGEYFKWAAHDDLHANTFLQRCIEPLERHPGVCWTHSRFSHVGPNGLPLANPGTCDLGYTALLGKPATSSSRESADPCRRFRAVLLGANGCVDVYGVIRRATLATTMLHLPYYGGEKVLVGELALRGRYHEIPETLFFVRVHASGSGSLATAKEQVLYENPKAVPWLTFTRWHLLCGHLKAVLRAPLSRSQRIRCFVVVLEYLMQIRKWRSVVLRTIRGRGTGGAYLEHSHHTG